MTEEKTEQSSLNENTNLEKGISPDEVDEKSISESHKKFLLKIHGTYHLDPLPTEDPNEPLNWSKGKKRFNFFMMAFQMFVQTFMSAGLSPAYSVMAAKYGTSMTMTSYLTTSQLALLGVCPLFFTPLMEKYGRKPFFIIGSFGALVTNIAGGFCNTYGAQMATRVLNGLFLSPISTVGPAFVAAMYFGKDRGAMNGVWSMILIMGSPMGPFLMGFVVQHIGFKWIYWIYAVVNFIQTIGWIFTEDTLYFPGKVNHNAKGIFGKLGFCKNPEKEVSLRVFLAPFTMAKYMRNVLMTFTTCIVFVYANIVFIVETPSIFQPLFHLDSQSMSLQYIPIMIGCFIGEMIAGKGSDVFMMKCQARRGGLRVPADRFILTYLGYVCAILGVLIWGIYLKNSKEGHWTVHPLIGSGISAAGADIVLTVTITYANDCQPQDSVLIGLFYMFFRLIFSFASSIYLPHMFDSINMAGSSIFMAAVMALCFVITVLLQICDWKKARKT